MAQTAGLTGSDGSDGSRRLLIVWWSKTGASEQLSAAAERGARETVAQMAGDEQMDVVRRLRCDYAGPDDLLAAQAYLFVAPENLGSLAGMMKDFFDRCYYPVLERIEGRPYASVVAAGSDGQGATRQMARIVTGWRLRAVAEPLIVNLGAQTPERILAPKRLTDEQMAGAAQLGATLVGGMLAGIW